MKLKQTLRIILVSFLSLISTLNSSTYAIAQTVAQSISQSNEHFTENEFTRRVQEQSKNLKVEIADVYVFNQEQLHWLAALRDHSYDILMNYENVDAEFIQNEQLTPINVLKYIPHPRHPEYLKVSLCSYFMMTDLAEDIIHHRNSTCIDLNGERYYQLDQLFESEEVAKNISEAKMWAREISTYAMFFAGSAAYVKNLAYRCAAKGINFQQYRKANKLNVFIMSLFAGLGADTVTRFAIPAPQERDVALRNGVNRVGLQDDLVFNHRIGVASDKDPVDIFKTLSQIIPRNHNDRVQLHTATFLQTQRAQVAGCHNCYQLKTVIDHPRLRQEENNAHQTRTYFSR